MRGLLLYDRLGITKLQIAKLIHDKVRATEGDHGAASEGFMDVDVVDEDPPTFISLHLGWWPSLLGNLGSWMSLTQIAPAPASTSTPSCAQCLMFVLLQCHTKFLLPGHTYQLCMIYIYRRNLGYLSNLSLMSEVCTDCA
jgi:hypothetical protein